VLLSLHNAGAVHRDLTPSNVFVTHTERLKLGDFGIARHRVGKRDVTADAFNPGFAPEALVDGTARAWRAADDVYQMGVVLAMLLTGDTESQPTAEDVKGFSISAPLKAILQRAIGPRHKRYRDAGEMLAALESRGHAFRRLRPPNSLKGKRVVFTGKLAGWTRRRAADLARAAGATVMPKITSATDVVVVGDLSPQWKADAKGQKLLDVDREAERGHDIPVVSERQFRRLIVSRKV
jgi:serine/threonine-protein kinase